MWDVQIQCHGLQMPVLDGYFQISELAALSTGIRPLNPWDRRLGGTQSWWKKQKFLSLLNKEF